MDSIQTAQNLSALVVFTAGLLSFFSPCVIPVLPVYLSLLTASESTGSRASGAGAGGAGAGGAGASDAAAHDASDEAGAASKEGGSAAIPQPQSTRLLSLPIINTVCFVVGISCAFFVLGAAFTSLGQLLSSHKQLLSQLGGVLLLILGIWILLPKTSLFSQREFRFRFAPSKSIGPLAAFAMGFLFSFAWTPCVGPLLSAVLIMASSAEHSSQGFLYIGLYTLGFIIPFLIVSLAASKLIPWLKTKGSIFAILHKVAGIILILIALALLSGYYNSFAAKLSSWGYGSASQQSTAQQSAQTNEAETADKEYRDKIAAEQANKQAAETPGTPEYEAAHPLAPDFNLSDQYGTRHELSSYSGKIVFLNFWATWCPPCRKEMPDLQKIYEEYKDDERLVFLGIANPKTKDNPQNADVSETEIKAFLKSGSYSFPVAFDYTGEVLANYRISAFPTSYIIGTDGRIRGYVPGAISYKALKNLLEDEFKRAGL